MSFPMQNHDMSKMLFCNATMLLLPCPAFLHLLTDFLLFPGLQVPVLQFLMSWLPYRPAAFSPTLREGKGSGRGVLFYQ